MSDLVDFLLARVEEDEAAARACVIPAHDGYKPHPELAEWFHAPGDEVLYVQTPEMLVHTYADPIYVTCDHEGLTSSVDDQVGEHIARHDPARVLAECEAYRRIIEQAIPKGWTDDGVPFGGGYVESWWDALLALATIWADHPDYRPEWALPN